MKPMISIIIPIYNMQKYMRQCIDSVRGQTYSNIEIILVDDGSTDDSGKICDDFEKKDKRIIVLHQKNLGVGVARNKGIEMANAEYITFVDPDDYLDESYVEKMSEEVKQNDLTICNAFYTYADCEKIGRYVGPPGECEFDESDIEGIRKFLLRRKKMNHDIFIPFIGTPWMKVYKREILYNHNIRFVPSVHPMEDTIFNLDYIGECKKIKYINKPFYHYRIHEESSTFGIKRNRYENYEKAFLYLKEHYMDEETLRDEIYDWAIGMLWFALSRQSFNHKCFLTYKERKEDYLKHVEDEEILDTISNANYDLIPVSKKIMVFLYKNKNALGLEVMCYAFHISRKFEKGNL